MNRLALALVAIAACADEPRVHELHLGTIVDDAGLGRATVTLDVARGDELVIYGDGEPRIVEIAASAGSATFDGAAGDTATWRRPHTLETTTLTIEVAGTRAADVTVWVRGAPPPAAARERALVWLDPILLDDRTVIGPAQVFAAASGTSHGGRLADAWLRRFATTAHSERVGPALLADDLATTLGVDPASWNLDQLPFRITGVHDRVDLAAREGACGQLRVSMASTHALYAPFHVIALFRQPAADDDIAPDGTIHCAGTARRWAWLSSLDASAFRTAAAAWLRTAITADNFVMLESVELTVSPWEWRQWTPRPGPSAELPIVLDNPPMFQTVDTATLNQPGATRDTFLAWVATNADALAARQLLIPETFRPPSARVAPGAPRMPLDLTGVPTDVLASHPGLAAQVEIVGCPACHTTNADFVQTSRDRVVSPFYDHELDARAHRLDELAAGAELPPPPFGPMQ